jgi:hypothetical protein
MKTDAKVYAMINDLSNSALNFLMCRHGLTVVDGPDMVAIVRNGYEAGTISGDEIISEWENDVDDEDA